MEIIKKKIVLEDFKSRIPSLVDTIEDDGTINSWGKMPKNVSLCGKIMRYGTLMRLYYSLLNVITKSAYYEYDREKKKWIPLNLDYKEVFKNKNNIKYETTLPLQNNDVKTIVGITNGDGFGFFYNEVKTITDSKDGFEVLQEINNLIGKIEVPPIKMCKKCNTLIVTNENECSEKDCGGELIEIEQPVYFPYFIYRTEVPDILEFMEDIKSKTDNCCEKKRYEDYGGDAFLIYLKDIAKSKLTKKESESIPTIDIPILLTSKLLDLGQYRTYNVDVSYEGDYSINTNDTTSSMTYEIVKTKGESKLKTLRKRKLSLDDNGKELPGILVKTLIKNSDGNNDEGNKEQKYIYTLELPYEVNYIKNIQPFTNNVLKGDLITDIKETCDFIEISEESYEEIKNILEEYGYEDKIDTTIPTIKDKEYKKGVDENHIEEIHSEYLSKKIHELSDEELKGRYPDKLYFQINYLINYILTDKNNKEITKEGTVYIAFHNPQIEFTYVLGGAFEYEKETITVQNPPFEEHDNTNPTEGIWYREVFPLKKMCVDTFTIDGSEHTIVFDVINFESKEFTYSYEGIDFPRKNYILCEDVRFQAETYKNDATHDTVFKDEKMTGINYPLKEEYNVAIDRGVSVAFEKHLQLSQINTWEDLENYRNGMFLNK